MYETHYEIYDSRDEVVRRNWEIQDCTDSVAIMSCEPLQDIDKAYQFLEKAWEAGSGCNLAVPFIEDGSVCYLVELTLDTDYMDYEDLFC